MFFFFHHKLLFFLSSINFGHTAQFKCHLSTTITHKAAVSSRCCFEYIRSWLLYWGRKLGFLLTSFPPKPCLHIQPAEWDVQIYVQIKFVRVILQWSDLQIAAATVCPLLIKTSSQCLHWQFMYELVVNYFQNLPNCEIWTFLRIIRNRQLFKNVI